MPEQQCPNCATSVPEGAAFCPQCGTRTAPAATSGATYGGGGDDPTRSDLQTDERPASVPGPAPAGWQSPAADAPVWRTPPSSGDPAGSGPPLADAPGWSSPTGAAGEVPAGWHTPPTQAPPAWPGEAGQWQSPAAAPPATPPLAPPAGGWQQPGSPQPATGPAPRARAPLKGMPVAGALAVVGGAIAVLSVWLNWIKIDIGDLGSSTATGWNSTDDAKIVLAIGIAAVVVGAVLFASRNPFLRILVLAAGLGALAVGIRDLLDVGPVADEIAKGGLPVSGHSAGIGLYLVLVAGAVLVAAALVSFLAGSRAPAVHARG